jgi:hypothetical protein
MCLVVICTLLNYNASTAMVMASDGNLIIIRKILSLDKAGKLLKILAKVTHVFEIYLFSS